MGASSSREVKVFSIMRAAMRSGCSAARWMATAPPRDLPNSTICGPKIPRLEEKPTPLVTYVERRRLDKEKGGEQDGGRHCPLPPPPEG